MNIVKEVIHYFKKPDINKYNFVTPAKKIFTFLQVYFFYLLIAFLLSVFTGFIRWKFNIEFKQIGLSENLFLILNLLVIPIIEESAFRLPLVYNRINLSISSFFISYFLISVLIAKNALDFSNYLLLKFIISIALSGMFFIIINIKNQFFSNFWLKNNKAVYYVFLILFTIRHFDMYIINWATIFLLPLVVLPQLYGGILLSFTRIRFGFLYAVIMHILVNFAAFFPRIIVYISSI